MSPSVASPPRPTLTRRVLPRGASTRDGALAAGLGVALAAIAFGAGGGTQLERTTIVEMLAVLGAAAVVVAAIVIAPPARRAWGAVTLAMFAVLAAYTALSVIWSIEPSDTWVEANRVLAYLSIFAAGVAIARIARDRVTAVAGAMAIAGLLVCGWGLLTEVFPGAFAPDEIYGRLREPYGYWNAVGLTAALAVAPLTWLAARRDGPLWMRVAAVPGLGVALLTIMLSASRGAIVASVIGMVVWFVFVPLRLRAAAALAVAAAVVAPATAIVFSSDALTENLQPLSERISAGRMLGAVLIVMLAVLAAAAYGLEWLRRTRPLPAAQRQPVGAVAIVVVAMVVVTTVIVVIASTGGVGDAWRSATDGSVPAVTNNPERLTATSSTRGGYWREAIDVWEVQPVIGVGAGTFGTARLHFRDDTLPVGHAHGFVPQTLADLGLVGLGLALALLVSFLVAALRAAGLRPGRDPGLPWSADRIALVTLLALVVIFGVHSALDWTWFVPGVAGMALLAAGFLAGRGPLRDEAETTGPQAGVTSETAVIAPNGTAPRRALVPRIIAAVVVGLLALSTAWTIWQPQRSAAASQESLELLADGDIEGAEAAAERARDRNPLAVEPLFDLASIEQARDQLPAARATLQEAVRLQPANARTWRTLGTFELREGNPARAVAVLRAALFLDPRNPSLRLEYVQARRVLANRVASQQRAAAQPQPTTTPETPSP